MNANEAKAPKIKRETKNKIKVEFDRTPLLERMQAKFLNVNFMVSISFGIFSACSL